MTLLLRASLIALVLGAAACTSSGTGGPSTSPPPPSSPVTTPSTTPISTPASTPPSTPATTAPSTTAPSTPRTRPGSIRPTPTSPPPVTSTTSSTPAPPTSSAVAPPPPHGVPACSAAQLSATGLRGGAGQGVETAGVVFTNRSATTCTVRGYPFARLRQNGAPIGRPAAKGPGAVRTITLKPKASAQSLLQATTTCQAPVSDQAAVRAPDTSALKLVDVELRACSLRAYPLQRA